MTVKPEAPAPSATDSSSNAPAAGWGQMLRENLKLVAIALLISLMVRIFIAEPRYIPSNSMQPTLQIGDRLLVEKLSYRLHQPQRGDIVVFEPPPQLQEVGYTPDQAFIKRVIGQPGQTVQVAQGQVYIEGQALTEPYILEAPAYELPPVTVPPGHLFVMGDNRNDSNDSHVWGFLPQTHVIGRAAFRFWPLSTAGRIPAGL